MQTKERTKYTSQTCRSVLKERSHFVVANYHIISLHSSDIFTRKQIIFYVHFLCASIFAIRGLQTFSAVFQQKALLEASTGCLNSTSLSPRISHSISHRRAQSRSCILHPQVMLQRGPAHRSIPWKGRRGSAWGHSCSWELPVQAPVLGEPAWGEQGEEGRRGVAGSPVI